MKYLDAIDNVVGLGGIGDLESIEDRLVEIEPEKLLDLSVQIRESLPVPKVFSSKYRFVGNTQMSALPYPCSNFECRDSSIEDTALFAAIYADEMVLFNPFSNRDYIKSDYFDFISEISYYISKLISLHPLIERGIITFSDFKSYDICQNCFNRGLSFALGNNSENSSFYFAIVKKFLEETEVFYDGKFDGSFSFSIKNAREYSGHFAGGFYTDRMRLPQGVGRFRKGARLTKEQVIELGIASNPARYMSNDIIQTNSVAELNKIANISTTEKQIQIITEIFGGQKFGPLIDVTYPLIGQADVREILKFRDSEWHHLHDFRKMIDEGIRSSEDLVGAFHDEEAKIEKIIRKNKRIQQRRIIDESAKISISAAAAIATGGISAVISAVIGAFGGKHLVDTLIPTIRERLQEPEEVRESPIYYAWKAKNRLDH